MSKTKLNGETTLWIEGDRINVGISGKHFTGTQRLSTKLDTQTGKMLAHELHMSQIERWAKILTSDGKHEVEAVCAGKTPTMSTLDASGERVSSLSRVGGELHLNVYDPSLATALFAVCQIVMLRDVSYVDDWVGLPVFSASDLVNDLLSLVPNNTGRTFLGNYPDSVQIGDLADVTLGTPQRPFIVVRGLKNDSFSWLRLLDIISTLSTQREYPLVVEVNEQTIQLDFSSTFRSVFTVRKNYTFDEAKHHYLVGTDAGTVRAFFAQIHGTGEQRGEITQIQLRAIEIPESSTRVEEGMVAHEIERVLNALESTERRPSPVRLALSADPAPVIDEIDQLKELLANQFYGDKLRVADVAEFLAAQGYRKI